MREIKFRAWSPTLKKMFTWEEMEKEEMNIYFISKHNAPLLMQYTGLKDKNGKEIYEGDLLSNGMGVVWSKYAFVPAYDYGRSDDFVDVAEDWGTNWNEKVEIIGNIYENPNLIS